MPAAVAVQIFHDGGAGELLELTAKGVLIEKKLGFQVRKGDLFSEMLADIVQNELNAGVGFAV